MIEGLDEHLGPECGADMRGWQPIATAPKDGEPILVTGIAGPGPWKGKPYHDIIAWRHGEWCCFDIETSDYTYPVGEPTHWMPLPEPPDAS